MTMGDGVRPNRGYFQPLMTPAWPHGSAGFFVDNPVHRRQTGDFMIWSVALGGAIGSVARFVLGSLVQRASGSGFPIGTLLINVTGSILLGFLMRYFVNGAPIAAEARLFLTAGFCGGFTTFSAFAYETVVLVDQGDWWRGSAYVILSVTLSLAGVFAGMGLAREVVAMRGGR
jgi:CrcB protein